MPYTVVLDFKTGMDRRRPFSACPQGSIYTLKDCHVTRGGDIEQRKAFVSKYSLPSGTHGLWKKGGALYVFGSGTTPVGMPAGVNYQRLQHPDGLAMSSILDVDLFNGKIYAIAKYSDDSVHHFYDGVRIEDWDNGVVRSGMTDNAGIATHLAALIDADSAYTATAASNVITITAAVAGTPFTISAETENVDGGTDDQSISLVQTQANANVTEEVLATASFRILKGSEDAGVNKIDSITVNGVDVLGAAVNWTTSNTVTAANIASQINSYTSSPDYSASASGDTVTISAAAGTGASVNGYAVVVNVSGNVITSSSGSIVLTAATEVSTLTVDGVSIISGAVASAGTISATMSDLADDINSHSSSPDYVAYAEGGTVYISKKAANAHADLVVAATTAASGAASTSNLVTSVTNLSGGITAAAGQAQIYTATVGGTFDVGDRFTITIDDKKFGAKDMPSQKGTACLTHETKIYALCGSLVQFCGVDAPIRWNVVDDTGAGFINMSNHDAGSEQLIGIEIYQNNVVAFARRVIQIWNMNADPELNTKLQIIKNTGARSHGSIKAVGDFDVFYHSDSGVRSLRARDSSNTASVNDVGTLIDDFVREHVITLTSDQIESADSIIEPVDGRYWLVLGGKVFVFSHFPASKISAWSYYEPGFNISRLVDVDDRIYARSGDTIYLYGGDDNNTYDATLPEVQLPFITSGTPGTLKEIVGFDIDCSGTWDVKILVDPRNEDRWIRLGEISGFTYNDADNAGIGNTTHFAPKLVGVGSGKKKISSIAVHFQGEAQEA